MKNLVFSKLHSRRGASLGVALLLTLMVLLFAASILAFSASANSKTVKADDNDRAYYLCASAMTLFSDAFSNKTIAIDYAHGAYAENTYSAGYPSASMVATAVFDQILNDESEMFPITLSHDDTDVTIVARAILSADYSLTVTVESVSYNGSDLVLPARNMIMIPTVSVKTYTVSDPSGDIERTELVYGTAMLQTIRW